MCHSGLQRITLACGHIRIYELMKPALLDQIRFDSSGWRGMKLDTLHTNDALPNTDAFEEPVWFTTKQF